MLCRGIASAKSFATSVNQRIMRAIRVNKWGGPEVLKLEADAPLPSITENQVLVKVYAAGINPVDTYIREGKHELYRPQLPYTPGRDGAGIVEAVGSKVTKVKKGERVFVNSSVTGTSAEFTAAEDTDVHPLSDKLSFTEGAALGIPYFTAYRCLILKAQVQVGQTILVHGASGAVGCAAVQIAKAYGLKVIGTAGSPEGAALVKQWGADHVFNHKQQDYTKQILEVTGGEGVDVIAEMLANVNLQIDTELAKVYGKIIIIGSRGPVEIMPRSVMAKELHIIGMTMARATKADWEEISEAVTAGIEKGWVRPHVGKVYKMDQLPKAHVDIINSSGAQGKMVLQVCE